MTWKAMSPGRACDLVDFWAGVQWPRTAEQVQQLGTEVGWIPDDDEFMENRLDALSEPSVAIITLPSGEVGSFSFWTTDVVRELSEQADAFLDDHYALLVREGCSRWGRPELTTGDDASARWTLPGGSRAVASRGPRSVVVDFTTPQYAAVLNDLGE